VVIALAVVGTGAAFAYRTFVGSPRSGEPPIIRADTSPNKMIPPTQTADASGKLIQDRMTGGGGEKLVSREEQPVDIPDSKSGPRVVFPPLNQNANPPPAASVAPGNRPPANTGNGTLSGDEPRKIHTFSVRGDQADAAASPVGKPAPTPAGRAAAPTPATRSASPAAAAANANASAAAPPPNSPLSLAPQQGAAPAEPHTRMASTTTAAPQPIAPAASGGGTGSYVQVSSQRNEADAQASFKSLQGKFPAALGSRAPLIKRADLGDKGTVYRAMVGPFASADEAVRFCTDLKTAGGQCFVPRN
jgi:sporulation related protein